MTNRLHQEISPYLLQHAENPVDWHPWGPEALALAETLDRPILLSIGYAACHWCHVMERESFEDAQVAELMNQNFVCIKVDREERPDIDDVYMAATIAINGSGGWPMTVFLTPEQTPFFAGTYFAPDGRNGRPGFGSLLRRIADCWENDRDGLFRQAAELTDHIRAQSQLEPGGNINTKSIKRAVDQLQRDFDSENGGFGKAPKFPPCQALHLLLRYHLRTQNVAGESSARAMIVRTLDAMKNGGIYDQLGGGFSRYSVDERWIVPHFEKMLYDNAQLARLYTEAFQVTQDPEYERVVRETLDYIVREMQDAAGGYYSAMDADSEGEEGKFFVFSKEELFRILPVELAAVFSDFYDVSEAGNFDGKNVLNRQRSLSDVASSHQISESDLSEKLQRAKQLVLAARRARIAPLTDDKILVSWNGLMIGAMAEASRVFAEPRYLESAERAARFITERMTDGDGRLLRAARAGRAHLGAYLEDYAFLSDALIDLYEASGQAAHLSRAKHLAEVLLRDFSDETSGAFFATSATSEELVVRTRDGNDGALPNAGAIAARALWRLSLHTGEASLAETARSALRAYGQRIERMPRAYMTALNVVDQMLHGAVELVFAGGFDACHALRRAVASEYLPQRVISFGPDHPLAKGKPSVQASPTLYICRNQTCEAPLTDPASVPARLRDDFRRAAEVQPPVLANPRVTGCATREATERYAARHDLPNTAYGPLGKTGLVVSRVGFGAYRAHAGIGDHQRALQQALTQGCNLIDTAATYNQGNSERCVASALAGVLRRQQIERAEVVVISKIGILAEPKPEGTFDEVVELGPGLSYSLNEACLNAQLSNSLDRTGLHTLDVCLLHNPEMLLHRLPKRDVLARLQRAFSWLEAQRAAGKISWYGVSSNTLRAASEDSSADADVLTLEDLLALEGEGFAVVQAPLNPLELQSASVLGLAQERGIAVLANRPLNALKGDTLVRLADAPESTDAPEFPRAHAIVAALEAEFKSRLGAVLGAVPDVKLDAGNLFTWAERIGEHELQSYEVWLEFERGILAKDLSRMLLAMDQSFAGKSLGEVWQEWKQRYTGALQELVLACRQVAASASNRRNSPFKAALQSDLLREFEGATLSQLVLWGLCGVPGVSCVLCGMRSPDYVRDALGALAWEPREEARTWLESAAQKLC
ncbi:MAG: hypothetical protein RJA70_891 [Pseudomonadota bacterium]|jgi:uncharacterized protein YyaL (SSP411 family)/aryl-alcohol dehydrogenase-like predicted oxidoreductase